MLSSLKYSTKDEVKINKLVWFNKMSLETKYEYK